MEADNASAETRVPIKVPEPADHAPPTLAEPASGPVAEMSGALDPARSSEARPTPSVEAPAVNGAQDSQPADSSSATDPTATQPSADQSNTNENLTNLDLGDETAEAEPISTAEDANGTPANKKAANGKRKSTGGVPEHKSKKLGKKKSMPKITHLDAKPGDYYFARLKSYPPWPSIICDEEMLPHTLIKTRPITTMRKDGTYNEAYDDGGKKVTDRTFPIMFLHTNEFAWIPNTDLAPLEPEKCAEAAEKGKSKTLYAAYQVAGEAHDLQYFKNMLDEHQKALQADEDAKKDRENEKANKADKKKRKSEVKADTQDVEMEDVDAEPVSVKKSSKKRKKEIDSDDEAVEKTPKTTKLKLTTNKTPATTEKKPKEKTSKSKSEKRKSKGAASDEEMVDAPEEKPEEPVDPAEARRAREKEVLFLRHKLQKGFLSRDQAPQEEEMPQMSNYIKKLENYSDLEVNIIRNTKINKVLKALIKLSSIPQDEQHQFRKRSMDLLSQWNKLLGADPVEGDNSGDKDNKSTPTANGVSEEKPEEKKEEKPAVSAPATASTLSLAPPKPTVEDATPVATPPAPSATSAPTLNIPSAPTSEPPAGSAAPSSEATTSDNPVKPASPVVPQVDAAPPLAP